MNWYIKDIYIYTFSNPFFPNPSSKEQLGSRWCHFSPGILVDGTEGIPNGGGGQSDHSRGETRRVPLEDDGGTVRVARKSE